MKDKYNLPLLPLLPLPPLLVQPLAFILSPAPPAPLAFFVVSIISQMLSFAANRGAIY